MYRPNLIPIKGWPAVLVKIEDDSAKWEKDKGKVDRVSGELRLHPEWDAEWVEFASWEITLNLNAFFRCHKGDVPRKLLAAGEGAKLIVSGEITDRNWKDEYPHLETLCWVEDFIVDTTGGVVSPAAARLLVADEKEYTLVANSPGAGKRVGVGV
jgi:hypothetical protein